MKLKNLKIWHFILLISIILLIGRFQLIVDLFYLIFRYTALLFNDFSAAINQIDLNFIEFTFSLIFVIALFTVAVFRKVKMFENKLTLQNGLLICTLYLLINSPLIVNYNPAFSNNLNQTKLLKPFSTAKMIVEPARENTFAEIKNSVIPQAYDKRIKFNAESKMEESSTKIFLFGTDQFGRDIFARVLYGARYSILIGLCTVILTLIIGSSLGFLSGYFENKANLIITRISEMFLSFPMIFFALFFLLLFGSNFGSIVLVLSLTSWMGLYKIIKSEVLVIKNKNFYLTSRKLGIGKVQSFLKEILPLVAVPTVVNLLFLFANVILAESALGFLGLTASDTYPSWGKMINDSQNYLTTSWWMFFFPSIALLLTLIYFNYLANRFNSYLDPRLKYD